MRGQREATCGLTSRQTSVAANAAGREALMAGCQGDTGQPGCVSFADANETLQLLPTLAKPPRETWTKTLAPTGEQLPPPCLLRTPDLTKEGMRDYLFAFHVFLRPASFCVQWAPFEKKGGEWLRKVSHNPPH